MNIDVGYEIPNQKTSPYSHDMNAKDFNSHQTNKASKLEGIEIISLENTNATDIRASLRRNFIKKVLGILIIQLIITTISIGVTFIDQENTRQFMRNHQYGLWIALGVSLCVIILLACYRNAFRKVPLNYILLFIYTLSTAYLLASIAAASKSTSVLFASGFTLFAVFVIATYAWKAKKDLTKKMSFVMALFSVLLMGLIFGLIFRSNILNVIIGAGFGLVFSFLFAIDVQRLSGRYEQKYSLDDYIIASLDLYIDIVQIFLSVLGISNFANN